MDKSLYYQSFSHSSEIDGFITRLKEYAEKSDNGNSIYVINKPLGENKYSYSYEKAMVILVPKYKIIFVDYGNNEEAFGDYVEDFLDDAGHISDKYEYLKVLGRPRKWRKEFVAEAVYEDICNKEIADFLSEFRLETKEQERKSEFLISLLTGSINNIDRTGVDIPNTLLEKIKKKIILFDGDQTRFIFDEPKKSRITIQGLAGTGKTELLLNKIKDLYTKNSDIKIVFTCHNKILAENLRERIPEFFDFMKVQEQIKWEEKLWVMSGWGSKADKNSGVYSYICNYYNIPFERFSYSTTFDGICRRALENLKEREDLKPCFDYVLIDESQDFTESFFALCSYVTSGCVYVAGDIFQNVFAETDVSEVKPDFLLNKCYRTDPKTLMCAHAISMGLFEGRDNVLRWLEDRAWEDCGYDIIKKDGYYDLYRRPLRRFEDLGSSKIKSIEVIPEQPEFYKERIISIIKSLKDENPTIRPEDIGIMFMENINRNYMLANELQVEIEDTFNWDVNIGYETKEKRKGALFISNRNNVKGLEFPFVICFMNGSLTDDLQTRNSIYMMLTRSFITSYFILPNDNEEVIGKIRAGVEYVNEKGHLHVEEPSDEKKKHLNNAIINTSNIYKSQREIAEEIMDELHIDKIYRERLHSIIGTAFREETDRDKLHEIIKTNYSFI